MARAPKKKTVKKKIVSQPRKVPSRPWWGVVLVALSVLSFVAILDFDISQSPDTTTDVADANKVGLLGARSSFWSFYTLGVATWMIPLYFMWMGVRFFVPQSPKRRSWTALAALASLLCCSGFIATLEIIGSIEGEKTFFRDQLSNGLGGIWGELLAGNVLVPYLGVFGSLFIFFVGFVAGSVFVFSDNIGKVIEFAQMKFRMSMEERAKLKQARLEAKEAAAEAKRAEKAAKAEAKKQAKVDAKAAKSSKKSKVVDAPAPERPPVDAEPPNDDRKPNLLTRPAGPPPGLAKGPNTKLSLNDPDTTRRRRSKPIMEEPEMPVDDKPLTSAIQEAQSEPKKPPLDASTIKIISGEKVEKAVATIPEQRGDYKFPPIHLLTEAPAIADMQPHDHAGTMDALVRTLDEFGVKVIPGEIHTGPVITRYEVKPAPGVRVEKIVNLDKNIALGLKALSVRILAPVPGKGTVGIEVPNTIAQMVCMRDIVESKAWADAKAEIPVVLGKDVTGKPMVADLTKMPHVLIAGSTGSGKTVCINAIIASLLYHAGPEDLRFIMVDPKVVEMQMYNALPHMLIPVVTEAKKVPGALKWLIAEMERRYQIFATENVRNIAGFNAKIAKTKAEKAKAAEMEQELSAEMTPEERAALTKVEVPRDDDAFEIPRKKLPYIVCIIDELADLMMVAPADIETGIARLAQLARAAGIHLILATQRPSVNVITGVIKANLPSRISFKVASKVDSRTILDGGGAEALIGKGDMLFIPPGTSNLVRAQGAFVSDDEINGIVDYLKDHNDPPNFAEEIQNQIDAGGEESGGAGGGAAKDGGDELLGDAIDVLRSTKRASTSMLQRRLRIGYNRAARLMEELEERDIVGPENGSSPREILVDLDAM